jgi:hypothetical protein
MDEITWWLRVGHRDEKAGAAACREAEHLRGKENDTRH